MAKCELKIRLDDEREVYHPGDVVRGVVEVRADREVEAQGLTVSLRWRTHGKGNPDETEVVEQELFVGTWRPGAPSEHNFALDLPAGPFTYHGHYLNVVWELTARADIPWALDPKAEREIVLTARPEAEPVWSTAVGMPDLLPEDLQPDAPAAPILPVARSIGKLGYFFRRRGCVSRVLLPAWALFIVWLGWASATDRGDAEERRILMAVIAVFLVLGAAGLFMRRFNLMRSAVAGGKLGKVVFEVEPRLARAGESLEIKIFCQPRQGVELKSIRVRLLAEERVVAGSATDGNTQTYRKLVLEEGPETVPGRELPAGLPVQIQRTLSIPSQAPPSFVAKHNQLDWTVRLRFEIARWPDCVEERQILVHP